MTASIVLVVYGICLVIYMAVGLFFLTGLFFPARNRSKDKPRVSVIVAARNEMGFLEATLDSLVVQDYPPDRWEIILVDDRSDDGTGSWMDRRASMHPRIRVIHIIDKPDGVSGKKHALEAGIAAASGSVLCFTDADCIVQPTWLTHMVEHFTPDVGLVIGFSSIKAVSMFERWQRFDFAAMMAAAAGAANWGRPMAASGQNLAYRKEAFLAAGGFDKIKHRLSGDDVLMMHQIRRLNRWRIVFAADPATFVTTRPEPTWASLFEQRARWASNSDMMLRLNPVFFIYLLAVYGLTGLLLGGIFLGGFSPHVLVAFAFGWINKFIIDLAVSLTGHRLMQIPFPAGMFMAWFFTQPFYVLWVGLKGSLRLFSWK